MGPGGVLMMLLLAGTQTDARGYGALVRIRTTGSVVRTIIQKGRHSHDGTDASVRHVGVVRPATKLLTDAAEQGRRRSETFQALLD